MKILLAIDESEFSKEAIRTLIEQVRTKGTEVRVLHVVEPITGYMSADMIPHFVPYVAEVEEDRRKQAKGLVQRSAQKLREEGFKTSEIVDVGDPKMKIIDHAAQWHADLIVVGSHGWKGLTTGQRVSVRGSSRSLLSRSCSDSECHRACPEKEGQALGKHRCEGRAQSKESMPGLDSQWKGIPHEVTLRKGEIWTEPSSPPDRGDTARECAFRSWCQNSQV